MDRNLNGQSPSQHPRTGLGVFVARGLAVHARGPR